MTTVKITAASLQRDRERRDRERAKLAVAYERAADVLVEIGGHRGRGAVAPSRGGVAAMSMAFTFTVSLSIRRESGKFATREDIAEAIEAALQEIEPDIYSLGPDGDSVYIMDDIDVREEPQPKRKKARS